MQDVIAGYMIVGLLSVAAFFAFRHWSRNWSRTRINLFAAGLIGLVFVYTLLLWESLLLTRLLPFSNLIILSNVYPVAAAILAALSLNGDANHPWHSVLPSTCLVGASLWSLIQPLVGTIPECADRWDKYGICYQTTDQTCTAACGATLLNYHGVSASEEEMAALCLTRDGTSWKGLYRGLKLKTEGTRLDVKMQYMSPEELAVCSQPVLLRVGNSNWLGNKRPNGVQDGWQPGELHSVVCLGRTQGYYIIADPNPEIGIEYWTRQELEMLWDGHSATIVEEGQTLPYPLRAQSTWDRMRQVAVN